MPRRRSDAFEWAGGVRFAGTDVWCDARRPLGLCLLSHAAVRTASRGGAGSPRLLATERTVALRAALGAPVGGEVLLAPFGRPFALGRARLELLPSGRLPGAAQLLVELGGNRALYAGDLNPAGGRTAEPAQVRAAQAVAFTCPPPPLELPLPPRPAVEAALLAAVRAALDEGVTPLVLAPAPGGAAEVAALLGAEGHALRVAPQLARVLSSYARLGVHLPGPAPRTLRGPPARDEVVLWPLQARDAAAVRRLKGARLLVASALAQDPQLVARLQVDAAFPLSVHADLPALVAHAAAAGARDAYLVGGISEGIVRAFAARGVRAHPLGPPEQMALFGAG